MVHDRYVVSEYSRKRAFWRAFGLFTAFFLADIALWYFFYTAPNNWIYAAALLVGLVAGIFLTAAVSLHFLQYALEPLDKD